MEETTIATEKNERSELDSPIAGPSVFVWPPRPSFYSAISINFRSILIVPLAKWNAIG